MAIGRPVKYTDREGGYWLPWEEGIDQSRVFSVLFQDGTIAEVRRGRAVDPELLRHQILDQDPWRHRLAGMRCRTCMHFVKKTPLPERSVGDERGALGRCRRHAPTMSGFPAIFESDWCGDHKLDEQKL